MAKGIELKKAVVIGIVVVLLLSILVYFVFIRDGGSSGDGNGDDDNGQVNRYPVANAGNDITVYGGETFYLNGSRSNDIDGDALTYSWDLDTNTDANNDGDPANDYFKKGVNISHSYPVPVTGEDVQYLVQLNVSDGELWDTSFVKVLVVAVELGPPEITMSCLHQVLPLGLEPQFILTVDLTSREEKYVNFTYELEGPDGVIIREGSILDLFANINESDIRYIDNPLSTQTFLDQGDIFNLNENTEIVEGCIFRLFYLNYRDPAGDIELTK